MQRKLYAILSSVMIASLLGGLAHAAVGRTPSKAAKAAKLKGTTVSHSPVPNANVVVGPFGGTNAGLPIQPGTYFLKWDPDVDCTYSTRSICSKWDDEAKVMFAKLPSLISANPKYWAFPIDSRGDGMIGVILDESKGTGSGYDTVYIDANRDWDLSNDQSVTLGALKQLDSVFTKWVSVESAQGRPGAVQTRNPLQVKLAAYLSDSEIYATLRMKGAWKGEIKSAAGPVACVLIDSNSNGSYCDFMPKPPGSPARYTGDSVCIDFPQTGNTQAIAFGSQAKPLDVVCKIGGCDYRIAPTSAGNVVTITSASAR